MLVLGGNLNSLILQNYDGKTYADKLLSGPKIGFMTRAA